MSHSAAAHDQHGLWLQAVERALKGADFDAKLVSRTADGIRIDPLYAKADHLPVRGRGATPWTVMQRVDHPDPDVANRQLLDDLQQGASGLILVMSGSVGARGYGLRIEDAADLDHVLEGVFIDLIPLSIEAAPFAGRRVASLLTDVVARRGLMASTVTLDLGLDPLGDAARCGGAPFSFDQLLAKAGDTARSVHETGFRGSFLRADGRVVHEAGGSEAQELAYVLSCLVTYLRVLEAAGLSITAAAARVGATLATDADEFLSVAKIRALRRLWAKLGSHCDLGGAQLTVHAETAWRSLTQRDPWVNLLRGSVGVFSAAVAGADRISVLPFTSALGLPDGFSRRLARNTQLILAQEANLWRVDDPAAGAGGFEAMTEALAEKAWSLFQEFERTGGLARALEQNKLQALIAATRSSRERDIARRKLPITGTSEFPLLAELPVSTLDVERGEGNALLQPDITFERLVPTRLAKPFEKLRDLSDEALALHGVRPKVFLANLGQRAAYASRAGFARNLFEAGGIEAVGDDGFTDVAGLAGAYRASGASIACLCSSDEVYGQADTGSDEPFAVAAAHTLRRAGAAGLFLAGRPGMLQTALTQAGVDVFIYVGCDVVEALQRAHHIAAHDEPVG